MNKSLQFYRQIFSTICKEKNFDRIAKPLILTKATDDGEIEFEWTVDESQVNRSGHMHGGCTATIFDITSVTSLYCFTQKIPGATVDLSISYLRPAKLGEQVILKTKCLKAGSSISFLEATIENKEGNVIAKAKQSHYKNSAK